MAYLIGGRLAFFHAPKTGGKFVLRACHVVGIPINPIASPGCHVGHATPYQVQDRRYNWKTSFAVVRNPFCWYRSAFRFLRSTRGDEDFRIPSDVWHPFQSKAFSELDDFNQFVNAVLDDQPSFLTRMFEAYVGAFGFGLVDDVLRSEFLIRDLATVLQKNGIATPDGRRVRSEILSDIPAANVSPKSIATNYDAATQRRVWTEEAEVFRRFYKGATWAKD